MGIDVNLYVEAYPTNDELVIANAYMRTRDMDFLLKDEKGMALRTYEPYFFEGADEARVVVNTLSRYYGTGYPRGCWPDIFNCIMCLKGAFPGKKVFYGGDTSDFGEEVTDELLSKLWAQWLKVGR